MNSDITKRKLIGSSFWSSLEKGVIEVVSFLVFLVLARLLQPTDYGIVALALVFVSLMGTISGLGITSAVVQIERLDAELLCSGFWLSLAMGLLFYLLICVSAPFTASWFGEAELAPVLLCLGLVGVFQAADAVPLALLTRQFRFRYLAFRSIASTLIGGVLGVALAMNGHGVWALVAQQLTMAVSRTVITWAGLGWLPSLSIGRRPLKRLLSVGLYVLGGMLSNTFSRHAANLLIGAFLGTRELGVYSIGFKVSQTATNVFLSSLSRLGLPVFSRLQEEPDALANTYLRLSSLGAAIVLPVFAMLALTAPALVPFLFGEQWRDSAAVLQILMFAACCQALMNLDGPLLIACGKAKLTFRLTLIRTALNLIGIAVAVNWGINAVAGALAVVALVMLPVWKLVVGKYSPVAPTLTNAQYLSIAAALSAMAGSVLILERFTSGLSPLSQIACQWLAGFFVYGIIVCALDRSLRATVQDLLTLGIGRR